MSVEDRKARKRRLVALLQLLGTPGVRVAHVEGHAVLMRGGSALLKISASHVADLRRRGFLAKREGAEIIASTGLSHLRDSGGSLPREGGRHGALTSLSEAASEALGGAEWLETAESPLAWLRTRKGRDGSPLITDAQYQAGERLRADGTRASLSPRLGVDLSRVAVNGTSPSDLSSGTLAARQRVERAVAAIGPDLSGVVLDVCVFLKGIEQVEQERGWPRRAGRVVLCLALDRLAAHYGIASVETGPETTRTRSWRAPAETA
jgi:hypothetical protein